MLALTPIWARSYWIDWITVGQGATLCEYRVVLNPFG